MKKFMHNADEIGFLIRSFYTFAYKYEHHACVFIFVYILLHKYRILCIEYKSFAAQFSFARILINLFNTQH